MRYKTLLSEGDAPLQIQIEHGPNAGVTFMFKKIAIKDTIFGNVKIKFDYEVLEGLEKVEKMSYTQKQNFERQLGDALLELITEHNENRNNRLTEFDPEGGVCEEGSSSSES